MTDYRSMSYVLHSLLNSLGLNEEQRQKRIACQQLIQLLYSFFCDLEYEQFTPLVSGSSFETTTIDGLSSDLDLMFIRKDVRIITDIADWKDDGVLTYMMENSGCQPAFVKLSELATVYPGPVYADSVVPPLQKYHVVGENGMVYLSNSIKDMLRETIQGEVHGPAITINEKANMPVKETDHVFTLKCSSFPKQALGWKQRQTALTRKRIDPSIIDDIHHCYLVGVGIKGSLSEHMEWRLSFSHIENRLIHAWNNVQYHCYVLMKFIQKDLINPVVPDILCSYHYKTLMMWMNEEYQTNFFILSNFEQCVLACLKNLAEAVNNRSLPHYFVEGCNLFYPKLATYSNTAQRLVAAIDNILVAWPQSLFSIKRCSLGKLFHFVLDNQSSLQMVCSTLVELRIECNSYELMYELQIVCRRYWDLRFQLINDRTKAFNNFCEFFPMATQPIHSDGNRKFLNFAFKDLICCIGLHQIRCMTLMSNNTDRKNISWGFRYIHRYSSSCCIDTGLKIAAHFVLTGNHRQALSFLNRVQNQIHSYTAFTCHHECCGNGVSSSIPVVYNNKPPLTEFCKHYFITAVTYKLPDIAHIPKGLVYEMFRYTSVSPVCDPFVYYWYQDAVIHCPVYLSYLRFLRHHALRQNVHRQTALDNMALSSNHLSKCGVNHQETNHNIMGHCHRIAGDTTRAYKEYRKSLRLERYSNVVLWHLAVLLRSEIRGNSK